MPPRGPFTLPDHGGLKGFDTLEDALKKFAKKPAVGVTQGGSSRKARGARVAATSGQARQTQTGE